MPPLESTNSGRQWPFEKFGVSPEVLRRAVAAVCRSYRCPLDHVDEALGVVHLQILVVHQKDEQYFKNAEHLTGYARKHARFSHLNVFDSAEMRRVEYRGSIAIDTVAPGVENEARQQLLNILGNCERLIGLLAGGEADVVKVFRMHHCKQMNEEAIAKQIGRGRVTVWRKLKIAYSILRRKLRAIDQG